MREGERDRERMGMCVYVNINTSENKTFIFSIPACIVVTYWCVCVCARVCGREGARDG